MIFKFWKNIAVFIALLILNVPSIVNAATYRVTKTPAWVSAVSIPDNNNPGQSKNKNSNGTEYLLVDNQIRISKQKREKYFHYISKALNTSGVEDISSISIDFDPSYETVKLHKIAILRNGKAINMLSRSKINVIQREKDLEYQIYDGAKTLNIFIEDVRQGDSVEYSYTIEGDNPVYAGHFSRYLEMEWSVPIDRIYYRVLLASSQKLFISNHITNIKPEISKRHGYTEYVWKKNQIAKKVKDQNTPKWYDPYKSVYLSDLNSWNEVVKWARPLYETGTIKQAQRKIINNILANDVTAEQKILSALSFVQNEVRYLGIEVGPRSHKPNPPEVVLRQRFGDCKDKSLLLVSLLRGMSIKAYPVLVNTGLGRGIKDIPPTTRVFNHVIVQVLVGNKHYWLDPTRTYQAGTLQTLYQPNYGYGLVISDDSADLEDMSSGYVHTKSVVEKFDVRDSVNQEANYRIISKYNGFYADDTRRYLSEKSHDEIQKTYLNYLARTYPDIEVANKISIADDKDNNRLVTVEKYHINNMWKVSNDKDKRYVYMEFVPFLIADSLSSVKAPIRTMPYAIVHPVRFHQTTEILVHKNARFKNEYNVVKDKAFQFTRKVSFENNRLVIDYVYESLRDYVPPEDIAQYAKDLKKVNDLIYYKIRKPNPALHIGKYQYKSDDINWIMVAATVVALVFFFVLLGKIMYRYDPEYIVSEDIKPSLNGIKGWLLLPAIGLVLSPIRIIVGSKDLLYVYSKTQWSILADKFDVARMLFLAGEIVVNVGLLVMLTYLIVMLFQKRNTFPRFCIAFYVLSFVVVLTDLLSARFLFAGIVQIDPSDIKELIQMGVSTIVWGSYFIFSKRVKATFTQQRKKSKPVVNNGLPTET